MPLRPSKAVLISVELRDFLARAEDGTVCPHILDLKSHSEYEKIFGYRSDWSLDLDT